MRSLITAGAIALSLMISLSGCGESDGDPSTLSASLRKDVAKDDSPETLARLATYLHEHPDVDIDSDLRDEVASMLVGNMPVIRKTIADAGSPTSLDADPDGLLRVVSQVATDDAEAKSVLVAVTTSSIDELDEATSAYIASPSTTARLDASLADSMVASAALATALGVDSYETPADTVDVLAYLVDGTEPSDLTPGIPLAIRTIVASTYLHAPEESLTGALAGRPRFDRPGVIDEVQRWIESERSPIPAANLPGTAESLETSWGAGEDMAIAARK